MIFPALHGASAGNDFRIRAFHLDMRAEVMTMAALEELADSLAANGINTLIMEWEATFPFEENATLCKAGAYSREEVQRFIGHCGSLGIDVIPLQNCFGHCEYILKNERYSILREDRKDPSQVCPLKISEATEIFSSIFGEVAAMHPSRYFHIGADETYLLGHCEDCRKVAEESGRSRLFVDYINAMCRLVEKMGKVPVIWADIILAHPEYLSELPDNLVFVDWNYGWKPDHFGKLENLYREGAVMWGAGSMRSGPDNIYLTQWMKHFNNIADFVEFSRKNNYEGMVQTSWSTSGTYGYWYDSGHEIIDMQPIRLVYPMNAFVILQDAFCEAVGSDRPFEPERFIRDYAVRKMGLDESGADVLWKFFSMPQETVSVTGDGIRVTGGRSFSEVLDSCIEMRDELASLSPKYRKSELAHWLLMLDIRISYLRFKQMESEYQAYGYTSRSADALGLRLERLLDNEKSLDRRFWKLNRGYLKDSEIRYINSMRTYKMHKLYEQVTNNIG